MLQLGSLSVPPSPHSPAPHPNHASLTNTPCRQRLLLSGVGWFAGGLSYYGVLLLSEGLSQAAAHGDGSVYVTVLTGFSYEVPGVAAAGLAVERLGRKTTLAAAFLQGGSGVLFWGLVAGEADSGGAGLALERLGRKAILAAPFFLAGKHVKCTP